MQPLRSTLVCQCGHTLKEHKWDWKGYDPTQNWGLILQTECTHCECQAFVPVVEPVKQ